MASRFPNHLKAHEETILISFWDLFDHLCIKFSCYGSPGLWVPAGTRGARIRKIICASPTMQRFAAWRHPVALRHDVWDPIPNTPVCTRGAAAAAPRPKRFKFVSDAVREKKDTATSHNFFASQIMETSPANASSQTPNKHHVRLLAMQRWTEHRRR